MADNSTPTARPNNFLARLPPELLADIVMDVYDTTLASAAYGKLKETLQSLKLDAKTLAHNAVNRIGIICEPAFPRKTSSGALTHADLILNVLMTGYKLKQFELYADSPGFQQHPTLECKPDHLANNSQATSAFRAEQLSLLAAIPVGMYKCIVRPLLDCAKTVTWIVPSNLQLPQPLNLPQGTSPRSDLRIVVAGKDCLRLTEHVVQILKGAQHALQTLALPTTNPAMMKELAGLFTPKRVKLPVLKDVTLRAPDRQGTAADVSKLSNYLYRKATRGIVVSEDGVPLSWAPSEGTHTGQRITHPIALSYTALKCVQIPAFLKRTILKGKPEIDKSTLAKLKFVDGNAIEFVQVHKQDWNRWTWEGSPLCASQFV